MHRRLFIYTTCLLTMLLVCPASSQTHHNVRPVRQDVILLAQTSAMGLAGILAKVPAREDQILMVRDYVHPVRFFDDNSGYFFVFDMEGICVAHGMDQSFEGKAMRSQTDKEGTPVFELMIEKALSGGGFVEYTWNKPNSTGSYEKLGYVEPIPGTNFFIGTGIYFPSP